MWILLVWLNEKIRKVSSFVVQYFEEYRKKQKMLNKSHEQSRDYNKIPDYLRRDMGLPPYGRHDQNNKS